MNRKCLLLLLSIVGFPLFAQADDPSALEANLCSSSGPTALAQQYAQPLCASSKAAKSVIGDAMAKAEKDAADQGGGVGEWFGNKSASAGGNLGKAAAPSAGIYSAPAPVPPAAAPAQPASPPAVAASPAANIYQ